MTIRFINLSRFLEAGPEVGSQVAATSDAGPLTVMGTSKGAECAAVRYSDGLDHLILIGPSAYGFPGRGREQNASSLTWRAQMLR